MEEISTKVKEFRKAQGMKQTDLAMVAGVGVRFIIDLESGKETVQFNKVMNVLDVLGLKLEIKEA